MYVRDENGDCVLQSQALSLVARVRSLLNTIKINGFKPLFLALADLRLYTYHIKKYDGTTRTVILTIKFIEDKQWEVVGLAELKEQIEGSIEVANKYYPLSNPTYLDEERKSNLFLESTIDYFVFFVPFSVILIVAFNRVFYCLFDYEISKYLRIYSFWWIFLEVMIQANIEFFIFLGFRNFSAFFQFSIESKLLMVLNISMFFLTFMAAFSSFVIYYSEYGRLGKYFLINMFRFPSSYWLMTLAYGVRPFLKGAIHALLYERWELQIWMLTGI